MAAVASAPSVEPPIVSSHGVNCLADRSQSDRNPVRPGGIRFGLSVRGASLPGCYIPPLSLRPSADEVEENHDTSTFNCYACLATSRLPFVSRDVPTMGCFHPQPPARLEAAILHESSKSQSSVGSPEHETWRRPSSWQGMETAHGTCCRLPSYILFEAWAGLV